MAVVSKILIKKENAYDLIEKIINPKFYSLSTRLEDENYKIYRNSLMAFRNVNTKEIINITDYEGCSFVNTRIMCSKEFLNSDFFKKYEVEIIFNICAIIKENKNYNNKHKVFDLNDKACYRVLNSTEFLTSDFIKEHYDEIFNTLDNIVIEREIEKKKTKKKIR